MNNIIVTISGPSGAGKSTLASKLCAKPHGLQFSEIVSHTTRARRIGEIEGTSYHFVSVKEFLTIPMLETTTVAGHLYGASRKEFEQLAAKDRIGVIVVDPSGATQINQACEQGLGWKTCNVFVDCPLKMLMYRNLSRFSDQCKHTTDYPAVLASSANRFVNLVEQELQWKHAGVWDVYIPIYVPDTEEQVVEKIENKILEMMAI